MPQTSFGWMLLALIVVFVVLIGIRKYKRLRESSATVSVPDNPVVPTAPAVFSDQKIADLDEAIAETRADKAEREEDYKPTKEKLGEIKDAIRNAKVPDERFSTISETAPHDPDDTSYAEEDDPAPAKERVIVESLATNPLSITKEIAEDVGAKPLGVTQQQQDDFLDAGVFPSPPSGSSSKKISIKFTPDEVRTIRASDKTDIELADEWGTSQKTIKRIIDRETYKNVI